MSATLTPELKKAITEKVNGMFLYGSKVNDMGERLEIILPDGLIYGSHIETIHRIAPQFGIQIKSGASGLIVTVF